MDAYRRNTFANVYNGPIGPGDESIFGFKVNCRTRGRGCSPVCHFDVVIDALTRATIAHDTHPGDMSATIAILVPI